MNDRRFITLTILTALLVAAGLIVSIFVAPRGARGISSTNPLKGSPDMVDRLAMFDSAQAFADGGLEHVRIETNSPASVVLDDRRTNTFPRYGYWTSPEITTEFAFTELLPSWNATVPANSGVRFDVRTRDARSGKWTPWLYVGQWGRSLGKRPRVLTCPFGTVHIDNLVLDRPANAWQIRATLESYEPDGAGPMPGIRRVAVSYSGAVRDAARREQLATPVTLSGDWRIDLPVPFFAQGTEAANVRGSICSPTSTTMVMAYHGVTRPVRENALAIYDAEHDIFGNWSRAVQRAGELGLDAWLTRFRNWEQVRSMIAARQPVVAAINFTKGEFPSALYDDTDGHLIVIRGFKENGDVIVNDPASRDKGNGVIYKADELGRAWFTNAGGVGYVIRGPRPAPAPATRAAGPPGVGHAPTTP